MNSNFIKIYTKEDTGYSVWVAKLHDEGTKQVKFGFYITDTKGSFSELIEVKKSKFKNANAYDFFLDYEGDFDNNDTVNIRISMQKNIFNIKSINSSSKIPLEKLHSILCDYVHRYSDKEGISFSEGFCNIKGKVFNNVIDELSVGYTGLEVKKYLKINELLRTNGNRIYDYSIGSNDGKIERYVSFKDADMESIKGLEYFEEMGKRWEEDNDN
jgi:hypothetical protein